jgi:transposase
MRLRDLADIVDRGPVAYGFDCGVWTSPMITRVIAERFGLGYHPGHVRKVPHRIGFSVQRPRRVLARADAAQEERWQRKPFPNLKKNESQHLGAVELYRAKFFYRRDSVFNAERYLAFLGKISRHYRRQGAVLIQDNASYYKDAAVWTWFASNRDWLEVHQLPSYRPELNPTERLWQYTRRNGTHNRYFADQEELVGTLTRVFDDMQTHPETIRPYLGFHCRS